jgi:hypothetical protein
MASAVPKTERLLKICVNHYKAPTCSDADFEKFMTTSHIQAAAGIIARHGIVRYAQVTTSFLPYSSYLPSAPKKKKKPLYS